MLAALAFGATLAQGAKEVTDYFGSGPGTLGAQFNTPRDVAVNETGAGVGDIGDIYVVDDSGNRVQRFDSDREFVSAWGADVAQPEGGSDFEICTAPGDCKAGVGSGGNGTTAGNGTLNRPQSIAIDQDTGILYVADRGNRRINAYDGDGSFLFAIGRDVQDPDGDAVAEICGEVPSDVCRQGDDGSGAGDIGATGSSGTLGIAVSPPDGDPASGSIFLADSQNRRVNTYDLDGENASSFGSATEFGETQPRKVAVDARGVVYASDSNNGGEIDRYDTEDVNGGGVGFMASIAAPPLLAGADDASATGGLAVDPDSDGAGTADEDVLYVLRAPSTGSTVVQQFGPANDPGATAAPGAADDQHGAGASFGFVTGFGADSSTSRLFVSTPAPTVGASGHRVYVLGEAPDPVATIDSVSDVGSTSATVEGTVDANGAQTGYRFEVSADGGSTWTARPTGGDLPHGDSDDAEDVSYELEGLDPGTEYDVRLVAKQTFGVATGTSNVESFETDPAAPVVSPLAEADPDTTSATLTGHIDPSGETTTYRFEYGLTDAYGDEAPALGGNLAAGHGSVPVSVELTGLQADTPYHYRLVATNDTGTTTGDDHVFTTDAESSAGPCPNAEFRKGAGALLPECRAYEQVSPVDKNGGEAIWFSAGLGEGGPSGARSVAEDGERALFASTAEFAGAEYGGAVNDTEYMSVRGETGWETKAVVPSVEPAAAGATVGITSPDLGHTLIQSPGIVRTDPPVTGDPEGINVYQRDSITALITPWFNVEGGAQEFVGPTASREWGHLAFGSSSVIPTNPPVPGIPDIFSAKVYEQVGGQLRLVSRKPDGTPFGHAQMGSAGIVGTGSVPFSTVGAVSDDGSHIFFSAGNDFLAPRDIYRRSEGATTTLASPSKRNVPDPAGFQTKVFRFATGDGNRVFFTSAEHLTDDANAGPTRTGSDLYRYDLAADELVNISATQGGNGARVEGVLGASDTGDRIYFVAMGQVVPGQGSASGTDPNLYLWEDDGTPDGATRFIATLSTADEGNWRELNGQWTARTTGNGRYLAFQSHASIPGHDNGGVQQIYRFDASDGDLACVSCNPGGDTPLGPSVFPDHFFSESVQRWEVPRVLSDDGQRVFFNTRDALVARDSNGKIDAYMWKDGEVSLLSTGTSDRDARFYNASASGDDAFVLTDEALVPQDRDFVIDLYDARVDGGFPAPDPDPDCAGDTCQGGGSPAPKAGDNGSASFEGRGDPETDRLELALRRPTRAQLRSLARGRRVGIRVRVTRAATVRVTARGRGIVVVARGSARSKKAGVVVVKLRLSGKARRWLRADGTVRIKLTASSPGARSRALSVRIGGNR